MSAAPRLVAENLTFVEAMKMLATLSTESYISIEGNNAEVCRGKTMWWYSKINPHNIVDFYGTERRDWQVWEAGE